MSAQEAFIATPEWELDVLLSRTPDDDDEDDDGPEDGAVLVEGAEPVEPEVPEGLKGMF